MIIQTTALVLRGMPSEGLTLQRVWHLDQTELSVSATAVLQPLSSDQSASDLATHTAWLSQAVLEFQDVQPLIMPQEGQFLNRNYLFHEALAALRECVLSGLNGSYHASFAVLRSALELFLSHLPGVRPEAKATECSNRVRLNFLYAILKLSYVGGETDQIFHKHANLSTGRANSACHLGPQLLVVCFELREPRIHFSLELREPRIHFRSEFADAVNLLVQKPSSFSNHGSTGEKDQLLTIFFYVPVCPV